MHPKLPPQLGLLALVLATAVAAGEATAAAADSPSTPRKWTRLLDHRQTAKELSLPVSASSRRFARAALRRSAGPLGLRGSLRHLRLLSIQRAPRVAGARDLQTLRFRHGEMFGNNARSAAFDAWSAVGRQPGNIEPPKGAGC